MIATYTPFSPAPIIPFRRLAASSRRRAIKLVNNDYMSLVEMSTMPVLFRSGSRARTPQFLAHGFKAQAITRARSYA